MWWCGPSRQPFESVTIADVSIRLYVANVVLVAVLVAGNLWLGLRFSTLPLAGTLSEIVVAICFATAGLAAWWLRPRSRIGPWLLVLGIVVLLNNPLDFRVPTEVPGHGVTVLIGGIASLLQYAVAGNVLLAYPTGRLAGRVERLVVLTTFALAALGGTLMLVTFTPDPPNCRNGCYDSPIQLVADQDLALRVWTMIQIIWIIVAVVVIVLLIRRSARATPRQRRVLRVTFVMFMLSTAFFLGRSIAVAMGSEESVPAQIFRYSHQWMAVVGVAGTFFVGLLRERLAFASVGTLVGRLERVPASKVEAALGETLRDHGLRVVFPTGTGLVDVLGRPCEPPNDGAQVMTALGDPPSVVLIHDPALLDDQELLDAAATAARLALDNARLHAEVRRRLEEVRASQQRIVAAADHERQRLERDLHDGAQQRFLGVGLALCGLRGRMENTPERDLVDEVTHELRVAIRELLEVARGIRPAILTDQGLASALAELARQAPLRVDLDIQVAVRPLPIVEATAYYFVSEALQNTVKHASASDVQITAVRDGNKLVVAVTDNGPGGAIERQGTGLIGLADRIGAVGGVFEIHSPPGDGTTLRAELPCA